MRTLALDIGEKRIGLAVSDPQGRISTPLRVIGYRSIAQAKQQIEAAIEEYGVEHILIGLPLSMDGTEGPHARHTRVLAERILDGIPLPKEYFDERLTSAQASDALHEIGIDSRRSRGTVDMIAASLFLQAWLEDDTHT